MWRGWADLERVNISWCLRHHLRAALGIVLRFGELLSIKSKDFRLTHNRRSTGKTTMLVAGPPYFHIRLGRFRMPDASAERTAEVSVSPENRKTCKRNRKERKRKHSLKTEFRISMSFNSLAF